MSKSRKKHAPNVPYVSSGQLVIEGFETPFSRSLDPNNRWVQLASRIPWDELISIYMRKHPAKRTGRPPLNPRIIIGALIIKHHCNLDDREVVSQITENIAMQYFLGYSSYDNRPPFDPSLFVEIRKRLGSEVLSEMNMKILELSRQLEEQKPTEPDKDDNSHPPTHKGDLLMDATVSPQDIAYPTDLNLLNEAREITEKIIDILHTPGDKKPRTYRKIARRAFLLVAKNRNPSKKLIRKAVGKQLGFVRRNIAYIDKMLDEFELFPLDKKTQRQFWVVQALYAQQAQMYAQSTHRVEDRIVSIHQPHVRPMVRNKSGAKVEFGAKLHVSLVEGFAFLDTISWDAFHEGSQLPAYVENYKSRFGFYPDRVLADQIYWSRANRKWLKEHHIKLAAKPLGRPSAKAVANHVSPGERNPIEGKFGQAKRGYGLNCIHARLRTTSQSWIASIILVLNLVKLTGKALLCWSFSAWKRSINSRKSRFWYMKKINLAPYRFNAPI